MRARQADDNAYFLADESLSDPCKPTSASLAMIDSTSSGCGGRAKTPSGDRSEPCLSSFEFLAIDEEKNDAETTEGGGNGSIDGTEEAPGFPTADFQMIMGTRGFDVDANASALRLTWLLGKVLLRRGLPNGGGTAWSRTPERPWAPPSRSTWPPDDRVAPSEPNIRHRRRRGGSLTLRDIGLLSPDRKSLELATKGKDWLRSFRDLDPRRQILNFFNDLSLEGVEDFESTGRCNGPLFRAMTPKILRAFPKSGIFSVWRPTSPDAIRKMITGDGTGKGLDIKGKSAERSAFSGFVPFLQIYDNAHKTKVGPMRAYHRVRVFYPNRESRDTAATALKMLTSSMVHVADLAEADMKREEERRRRNKESLLFMRNMHASLCDINRCRMDDPSVYLIDEYACSQGVYGLDIPEKLFWEGYVVPNDITRAPGSRYDTGRLSMPEFQQMNIDTLRNWNEEGSNPRPVLWHADCERPGRDAPEGTNPMCPLGLLMAYEEGDKVTPVVSDFDCFLLGTRGVKYNEPLGELERSMLSMCVDQIEGILETPREGTRWIQRWLEAKKKHHDEFADFSHEVPRFGNADPRSYKIIGGAVHRLKSNGAVRHGPECFNYGFPQELDDQYLIVSDSFPGVPWRYASPRVLIDILCEKIEEGFTFPLNPKWILCDPGWRRVYDKLMVSTKQNVQRSMNIWYPDEIRKRIDDISAKFPNGFVDRGRDACPLGHSSSAATDLAEMELRKYKVKAEAKQKLQYASSQGRILRKLRESARALDNTPSGHKDATVPTED